MAESIFLTVYGSPILQAAVGIDPGSTAPMRKAGKTPMHRQFAEKRIAELRAQMNIGGIRECVVRAALYVGMPRARVDERGFEMICRLRHLGSEDGRMTLAEFKTMVREQFFMLLIDQEAALAAMPALLPPDPEKRTQALARLQQVLGASGEIVGESATRLQRIAQLLGVGLQKTDEPKRPAAAAQAKAKAQQRIAP